MEPVQNIQAGWTATRTGVIKSQDGLFYTVAVEFTDGVETLKKSFPVGSEEELAKVIQNQLDRLNTLASLNPDDLLNPPLSKEPLPNIPAVSDGQAEFYADYFLLRRMMKAVESGLMATADQAFVDQLAKVKNGFRVEYLPELPII